MRAKVFVWPSSVQKVRVRVASLNKKFDEKPQPLPDLSEDKYQEFKDDLASHADYDKLKNDEMENPFTLESY